MSNPIALPVNEGDQVRSKLDAAACGKVVRVIMEPPRGSGSYTERYVVERSDGPGCFEAGPFDIVKI